MAHAPRESAIDARATIVTAAIEAVLEEVAQNHSLHIHCTTVLRHERTKD
jgi:hypothetical protein